MSGDGSGRAGEQSVAHAVMQNAVAAWLADQCDGAILDGFVVQASGRRIEDLDGNRTQYLSGVARGQSTHVTVGLSVMMADSIRNYATSPEET